jgi:hypothetical protein
VIEPEEVGGLEPIQRTKPLMPRRPRRKKDGHDRRGLSKKDSPKLQAFYEDKKGPHEWHPDLPWSNRHV